MLATLLLDVYNELCAGGFPRILRSVRSVLDMLLALSCLASMMLPLKGGGRFGLSSARLLSQRRAGETHSPGSGLLCRRSI